MRFVDAVRTIRRKGRIPENNQLYTVWGEHLDPDHLLEEYPRPQLRRDNYTILNGYWNYSINQDPHFPTCFDGIILVPFSPESVLSGVNKQLQPGEFLWYERYIIIDNLMKDRRCLLHFGAVDQYCEVYLNHKKVMEHMGGYLPFTVDITKELKEGDNLLTLKVVDNSDTSYHSRGKQKLGRGGMFYTAQSGVWQTVWMEWVPDLYITSLKITPIVDSSAVRVEIFLNEDFNPDKVADTQFLIKIYHNGNTSASVQS